MQADARDLGGRLARGWAATTVAAAGTTLALGDGRAAAAVAGVSLVGFLVARRGVLREIAAFTTLADGVEAEGARTGRLDLDLPGEAGRVARGIAALRDHARAQVEATEADARLARARTAELLDATPIGVVVVGADRRVEQVNAPLLALLGLQRHPAGLLPLEGLHAVEVADAIDEALRGRDAKVRDVAVADRDLVVSAHPLAGGGVLALVRDVSDERQVERARTDFVANVSHELRTPIAAILGFAETLLDTPGGLAPEIAIMGRAIHRNAVRLRRLFEDLLTLHRIETRRQDLPRQEIELGPLLADALVSAVDAAAAKGVGFEVEVPEDLAVRANPEALAAIVGNLAANACKYTPSGGAVTVRAVAVPDGVRLDVVDTGIGIPRAHQARVFERFYRVDEGRAREVGGTGLGLAIAKHLAEATGCRISLRSEEGHGSTFSIHVPRSPTARTLRP